MSERSIRGEGGLLTGATLNIEKPDTISWQSWPRWLLTEGLYSCNKSPYLSLCRRHLRCERAATAERREW